MLTLQTSFIKATNIIFVSKSFFVFRCTPLSWRLKGVFGPVSKIHHSFKSYKTVHLNIALCYKIRYNSLTIPLKQWSLETKKILFATLYNFSRGKNPLKKILRDSFSPFLKTGVTLKLTVTLLLAPQSEGWWAFSSLRHAFYVDLTDKFYKSN